MVWTVVVEETAAVDVHSSVASDATSVGGTSSSPLPAAMETRIDEVSTKLEVYDEVHNERYG